MGKLKIFGWETPFEEPQLPNLVGAVKGEANLVDEMGWRDSFDSAKQWIQEHINDPIREKVLNPGGDVLSFWWDWNFNQIPGWFKRRLDGLTNLDWLNPASWGKDVWITLAIIAVIVTIILKVIF